MIKNRSVRVIEPKVIALNSQYWAMHACAFLEFFYEHKNSEINVFRNINPEEAPLTMASLKSHATNSFISRMRAYFKNWGLQYLLSHYLRTKDGECYVNTLLDCLSEALDVDLHRDLISYEWYVTGDDSRSGNRFIRENDSQLIGGRGLTVSSYEKSKHTDLCFFLNYREDLYGGDGFRYEYSILGEVEGKEDSNIYRSSYWERKPELSQFGIGVSTQHKTNVSIIRSMYGNKSILMLNSKENIVEDFIDVLQVFEWVFNGRFEHGDRPPRWFRQAGLLSTMEYLLNAWNTPIYQVIQELRMLIDVSDRSISNNSKITMPSVPKVIL